MAKIESGDLEPDVVRVLREAAVGRGNEPGFLTAYQILKRLPEKLQSELQAAYGLSGKEAGVNFGGASRVAQVADEAAIVEKRYLDTRGLQFDAGQGTDVEAGFSLCAIFRAIP